MPPRFPDERDAERLGSRVLRPARPRLKEARAAVAGVRDPREAWEALAARELIPMAWVGEPSRSFRNGWRRSYPPTVDAAAMLGADAEGALTAEELLRECAHRLRELGYPTGPDAPVRWWFVAPSRNALDLTVDEAWWQLGRLAREGAGQTLGLNSVPLDDRTSTALWRGAQAGRTLDDPRRNATRGAPVLSRFVDEAMRALWSARAWYLGARDEVVLPRLDGERDDDDDRDDDDRDDDDPMRFSRRRARTRSGPWAGRPIGEAPDPFEPLLQLYATGYAPGAIRDELVLYALDQPA